jgi:hypothetical protein
LTTRNQQTQQWLFARGEQASPRWEEDANLSQSAGQLESGEQTSSQGQRTSGGNQQQVEDLRGEESNVASTPSCPEQRTVAIGITH